METTDSMRQSLEELERKVARLEEANRLKDVFLGSLSHELSNAFLPYQFALQLLGRKPTDPAIIEQVRSMLAEHSEGVNQFMENLRTVSRILRGKLQAECSTTDLKAIVERELLGFQAAFDKSGHQISVSLPAHSVVLEGDEKLLGLMVGHLLDNAAKFTDPGGHIWLSLTREDGETVLRVRDTGPGIAPNLLPRLFELFVQADPLAGGWGAGLAIVRTVAELHGGRVEAFSGGPRPGSEFVVHLPA